MDLLDYGSSEDEDETQEEAPTITTAPPTSKQPPPSLKTQENKKGKKILSLQSVLPAHILEQLTQSQVRGGDDDDEEDDDDWKPSHHPKNKAAAATLSTPQPTGKDTGIDSFLCELQKSAPAATKPVLQSKGAPTSSKAGSVAAKSKLGAAFLSTTTTVVTTTTRKKGDDVRDIHGEASPVEPEDVSKGMHAPVVAAAAAPAKQTTSSSLSSLPRPSRTVRVSTAPFVPPAAAAATTTTALEEEESIMTTTTGPNKKRRRQDMERLLRQGQLDAALVQGGGHNSSAVLALDQPQAFVPTDGAAQNVDTTGLVRMAATAMYDPSQGAAVAGSGAGRGKNQINHLLASAANLELARARGMASKPGQNSHRVNAKRKYGW